MVFSIKYGENKNTIIINNTNEIDWYHADVDKFKIDVPKNLSFLKKLSLELDILRPCRNGEFITEYSNVTFFHNATEDPTELIGKCYGDLFPHLKEYIYPLFTRIYQSKGKENVFLRYHRKGKISLIVKIIIVYDHDRLILFYDNLTDTEREKEELERLYRNIEDAEEGSKFTISYKRSNGTFFYNKGVYHILERKPRESDEYHDIIFEVMDEEDKKRFEEFLSNCKPNQKNSIKLKIRTENFKTKYLDIFIKMVYDNDSNFLQRSNYAKDITEEVLKQKEIELLGITLNDVEEINKFSISYLRRNGTHYHDSTLYKIIEREPRKEDKYNYLIPQYVIPSQKEKLNNIIRKSNSEQPPTSQELIIKTEKGNIKHVQLSIKDVYDNDEMFVRRSQYVRDITEEKIKEQKIIQANHDKDILIRESNHRIKNNLNLLLRFISLEERFTKDDKEIIEKTKGRLESLIVFHEKLYKTSNFKEIELNEYLKKFMKDFYNIYSDTYPGIIIRCDDFDEITVPNDTIRVLSLILNELIINSLKHAYTNYNINNKELYVNVKKLSDNKIELHYKDNGKELPEDFNPENSTGLGWTVIRLLTKQIDGRSKIYNNNGMNFKITIPMNVNDDELLE